MKYVIGLTLLFLYACSFSSPCYADMYKYQDENGAICITNSVDAVPKKFRKGMTVVKEEVPKQDKLLAPVPSRPPAQTGQGDARVTQASDQVQQAALSQVAVQKANRPKYVRTALIIAGMLCACVIMGRLTSSLGVPRLGTVLFLAIVLSGGVYLYGMYVQELRTVFNGLRTDALKIKKNVETREHKTDYMLKEMPERVKEPQDN